MDTRIVLEAVLTDEWRARVHDAIDTQPDDTSEHCWWLDEQRLAAELEALVDGREDEEFWRYGGA